jgi:hypothetical protein
MAIEARMMTRNCVRCGCPGEVPICSPDPHMPVLTIVFGAKSDGAPGLCCAECKAELRPQWRHVRPNPWSEREWRLVAKNAVK